VAACSGSLISGIQQPDFQKQLAKFGLIIRAYLLDQKFLRRTRSPVSPLPCAALPEPELGCRRDGRLGSEQPPASRPSLAEPIRVGDRGQDTMAGRDGQFLPFDALPFRRPLPLDLLRRKRIGMVDAASWIGTNLDDLAALAAVHDYGLGHLVTRFLNGCELGACAVRLGFLDLQLHVLIPSQGSALAGIPRRRNLD
jgi:hypothetical protein